MGQAPPKPFEKGHKKKGGRKKGVPNKHSRQLKDAIMNAFETVGGESYLVLVAQSDPKTFCQLLGKVIPLDVKANLSGNININIMPDEEEL